MSSAVVSALLTAPATAQVTTLIPRRVLFGDPERLSPLISPDGTRLAYLAPDSGTLNVWVRTLGAHDDRQVTRDSSGRPIREFWWRGDGRHVLYTQDRAGDENDHLYQTDIATRETRDLTPFDGVQVGLVAVDPNHPHQAIVAMNRRDPKLRDAYRLDLASGKLTLEAKNPGDVVQWFPDNALEVRVAQVVRPDGGLEYRVRNHRRSRWRRLRVESANETFSRIVGFTPDNRKVWLLSSVDANASRLLEVDLTTGRSHAVAEDPAFDASGVLRHPRSHAIQAVEFTRARREWEALDSTMLPDLAALKSVRDGDIRITSRDLADRTWIVEYEVSDGPLQYYAYDRGSKRAGFLFAHIPQLERYALARMEPISFRARDGMAIHGYLTLPAGGGRSGLPLVILVHGGPWLRYRWGFDPEVQWLANRGYGVLQVNFRGSTGYGKAYLSAGHREWAGKMHTDLLDGKSWAVNHGYADPARVCLFGGSYGGYATLVGLTFTPEEFACGVDVVGPSNLVSFLQSLPPYWETIKAIFRRRVGDVETEPEFLKSRSPFFKIDQISKPLLVAHGANDPRVKRAESDQLVQALRRKGVAVEYLLFLDEGHGFSRPENMLAFSAAAEAFLAKYLEGRVEPPSPNEAVTEQCRDLPGAATPSSASRPGTRGRTAPHGACWVGQSVDETP